MFEWCKTFREGKERVENTPQNRRSRTSITPSNIDCANVLIRDNRGIIMKELASTLNISVGSVETIVKTHLHYRPHTARKTMEIIRKLKWDLLPHPPYSPDIVPSDFFLFGRLKVIWRECGLSVTTQWSRMFRNGYTSNQRTFRKRVKTVAKTLKKCTVANGDYFEG